MKYRLSRKNPNLVRLLPLDAFYKSVPAFVYPSNEALGIKIRVELFTNCGYFTDDQLLVPFGASIKVGDDFSRTVGECLEVLSSHAYIIANLWGAVKEKLLFSLCSVIRFRAGASMVSPMYRTAWSLVFHDWQHSPRTDVEVFPCV